MSKYDYDLIVIGAGSGGISAAMLGKNLGKKTALVEKNKIGGECTWSGCVPSKALIRTAEAAHEIREMHRLGLKTIAPVELDTDGVMDHVRSIIHDIYQEEKPEVFEKLGIDVYIGAAQFIDAHTIKTGGKTISAKSFVLSTGSGAAIPDIPGLADIDYLTNENLFLLPKLPESLLVIGGGPIGVEMAQALARLGVKTTIVQRSTMLKKDDSELVDMLIEHLRREDVQIYLNTKQKQFKKANGDIILVAENDELGEFELTSKAVLIATGRRPNVNGLDLDKAGVAYTQDGIKVNNKLQTSTANIYAIGDVINGPLFSHVAEYQATNAVQNAVLPIPIKKKVNYDWIPWVTFTAPELAHVGLTEAEARRKWGDKTRVYRQSYKNIDRAKTDVQTTGMSKFIFDPKGSLVGAHIFGNHAAELLHEAMLAKALGKSFAKLGSMVHAYPTYGDVVKRPSIKFYVDQLQNMFLVKIVKKLFSKK